VLNKFLLSFFFLPLSAGLVAQSSAFGDSSLIGKWVFKGPENLAGKCIKALFDGDSTIFQVTEAGGIWSASIENPTKWSLLNEDEQLSQPIDAAITDEGILVCTISDGCLIFNSGIWLPSTGLISMTDFGIPLQVRARSSNVLLLAHERVNALGKMFTSIYSSTDAGKTFQRLLMYDPDIYGPPSYFDLDQPIGSEALYLLYRDSLAQLNTVSGNLETLGRIPLFMFGEVFLSGAVYGDSLRLFAQVGNYTYVSNHRGDLWQQVGFHNKLPSTKANFMADPVDSNKLYAAHIYLETSTDRGITWNPISTPDGFDTDLDSLPGYPSGLAAYTNDSFFVFHKHGLHLIGKSDYGPKYITPSITSTDALEAVVVADSLWLSTNYFGLWNTDNNVGSRKIAAHFGARIKKQDSLIWVFNDSILSVFDLRQSFSTPIQTIPHQLVNLVRSNIPAVTYKNQLIVGGGYRQQDTTSGSFIYTFEFNSGNITAVRGDVNFDLFPYKSERISALGVSPLSANIRYVATNFGNFYYSADSGITWTKTTFFSLPDTSLPGNHVIYTSRENAAVVYVAGSGKRGIPIHRSTNGGRDFVPFSTGLSGIDVLDFNSLFGDSILLAITNKGPYIYDKHHRRWEACTDTSLSSFRPLRWIHSENRMAYTVPGSGIWEFEMMPKPKKDTSIGIAEVADHNCRIFPNPVTQSIILSCDKGVENITGIDFVNYLGQKTFAAEIPRDVYKIELPGEMPSGLYIVRLINKELQVVAQYIIRKN
jgi:hypothetical protein